MATSSLIDIQKILGTYSKELDDALYEEANRVAKEGTKKLRNVRTTYKVRTGKYNKGWRMEIEKGFGTVQATIHNKTNYQLTHLLERGHDYVGRDGQRKKGAAKPYPHIAPVEQECIKEFEEKITKRIEEGL